MSNLQKDTLKTVVAHPILEGHYNLDGAPPALGPAASLAKTRLDVETGILETDRRQIAQGLSRVLADTYTLYSKTQNFHWNVIGDKFYSLHLLFEQQYRELAEAIDTLAERIRSLGIVTPATLSEFLELSRVKEKRGTLNATEMIGALVDDNELVARSSRELGELSAKASDDATSDLLAQRIRTHEKAAWMLRSFLG